MLDLSLFNVSDNVQILEVSVKVIQLRQRVFLNSPQSQLKFHCPL